MFPLEWLIEHVASHANMFSWKSLGQRGEGRTLEKPQEPWNGKLLKASFSSWAFLVAQRVKCLPTMRETWVRSLGWEDPLEKEMAAHSSTLAWKIPWTEEPGRLQPMGSQRVGHDWTTSLSLLWWLFIVTTVVRKQTCLFFFVVASDSRQTWIQHSQLCSLEQSACYYMHCAFSVLWHI